MKKSVFLLTAATAAALLAGCVVTSVYPFCTEKELVSDPALLGDWTKEKEHWKFEKAGEGPLYRLTYSEEGGKPSVMEARLFKLGGAAFLDLFANSDSEGCPPPIPSHLLLRVFQTTPTLKMAALNHDWLKARLEKEPKALRHHVVRTGEKPEDRRIVLTADTPRLQRFLLKHLETGAAWEGGFELQRRAAAEGGSKANP